MQSKLKLNAAWRFRIATSVLQPLIPSFNAQAERLEELPAAKVPMP